MRVIVTGATGFVGGNLTKYLVKNNHEVCAIVRPTSDIEKLPRSVEIITYHNGNLIEEISKLRKAKNIDLVFHLASLYISQHEHNDIAKLIQSNIIFGTELLDAMAHNNIKNFVNAGTAWQHYQNKEYNPVNLYAATKQAFDDILKYFIEACGLHAITLQLFDTYGRNDKRKKILNLFQSAIEKKQELLMSPGEQEIDLVHIDDVIEAFVTAGKYLVEEQYGNCGTYAVSSGKPVRLRELEAIVRRVAGNDLRVKWGGIPYRDRTVMKVWNAGKNLPGWKPKISLEEGVRDFMNGDKIN